MIRKVWIINLVLAIVAALLFSAAYRAWHAGDLKEAAGLSNLEGETGRTSVPDVNTAKVGNYQTIVKNNLFSPDRTEPVKVQKQESKIEDTSSQVTPQERTPPETIKKQYLLYGVVRTKNGARALIKSPVKDKDEDPVRWVSQGDRVGDFRVSEILNDGFSIENSTTRYTISLYKETDAGGQTAAVAPKAAADSPKVITTQPSSTATQSSNSTVKKEESGDVIVVDGVKYQIVETPFGNTRMRID